MSASIVNTSPATRAVNWESSFPSATSAGCSGEIGGHHRVNTVVFTRSISENAPEAVAIKQSRDLQSAKEFALLWFFVNDRARPAGYRIQDLNQSFLAGLKLRKQGCNRQEPIMKQIKKILAPTDLSNLARPGIRFALETAQACGAEVIVYHVISYEDAEFPVHHGAEQWVASGESSEEIQELIQKRKRDVDRYLIENFSDALSGLKIRQEVGIGIPYKMIVEKAAVEEVDMIMMSTHGRSGLRHLLIGSVTENVVRLAACPVLSIRPTDKESSKT